jgi:protein SCO1/2
VRRLLVGLTLVLSACLCPPARATTILDVKDAIDVPDFTLTERSGRLVSKADLHGKVWVACFFFTRCNTACPQIIATMSRLQERLHKAGLDDVILVSISVDPEHDTPEVLAKYAAAHEADANRWLFLTGKNDEEVFPVAKGFFLPAQRNEGKERTPGNEVAHSSRLVLVDREGRIRGLFDGRQLDEEGQPVDELPELEKTIRHLREFDFPSLNAILNGASGVLLVVGYLAIRRRQVALHKACMLTALAVSTAFLVSYLYYHIVVRHGEPTYFTGPSEARAIYLGILLSHTVLAAIVAPLALITAYLALAGKLKGHRRLARVTLPLWLYVSVTGVVVYWMLYHLYPAA